MIPISKPGAKFEYAEYYGPKIVDIHEQTVKARKRLEDNPDEDQVRVHAHGYTDAQCNDGCLIWFQDGTKKKVLDKE